MRIPRVYHPSSLTEGSTILLTEQAAHYLTRVLRLRIDSPLILFNGLGGEFHAQISTIDKHQLTVVIGKKDIREVESPLEMHLGQAVSRSEKMDFTIQKAVELGVHKITPLITERCGVKLSNDRVDKKLQHWQSVITSACEQSGRNHIPTITSPILFTQWLNQTQEDVSLILHPFASKKLNEISITLPQKVNIAIGSEGGFSENEITAAIAKNFQPICLGPRILRTETAAIAALTALQCHWGDFK